MADVDLQALLDGLAAELGAPVVLEDSELRLVAHTDHSGVIDTVRHSSIIGRRATPEVRTWFEQLGIQAALEPIRTPENRELGALARWCVPVRFRGSLLGYVWILTDRLAANALEPATAAAEEIAPILNGRRVRTQTESDLLRLVLVPRPGFERDGLAAAASALSYDTHSGRFTVIAVADLAREDLDPAGLSDLSLALRRATTQAHSDSALTGALSGLAVALVPLRESADHRPDQRLAESIHRNLLQLDSELNPIVAIGSATDLAHASDSFMEARRTLQMMRVIPDFRPVSAWGDLGVFRALAQLPLEELHRGILDSRVEELLENAELASTAETFLDRAGNVQQTAEGLFLHRATLYQRLDRIKALYGLDLRRSGHDRLLVHLSLKLAHIARLSAPPAGR